MSRTTPEIRNKAYRPRLRLEDTSSSESNWSVSAKPSRDQSKCCRVLHQLNHKQVKQGSKLHRTRDTAEIRISRHFRWSAFVAMATYVFRWKSRENFTSRASSAFLVHNLWTRANASECSISHKQGRKCRAHAICFTRKYSNRFQSKATLTFGWLSPREESTLVRHSVESDVLPASRRFNMITLHDCWTHLPRESKVLCRPGNNHTERFWDFGLK